MLPAPYRDRRNFMVKLKHHISGTGEDGVYDDLCTTLMLPAMGVDPSGNVFHDLFGIGTGRK